MSSPSADHRCILLFSGGLDSTSLIPILQERGFTLFPIFCDYGQTSRDMELAAAQKLSRALLREPLRIVPLDLWNRAQYPLLGAASAKSAPSASADFFLPFRNLALVLAGAARALEVGAGYIALGFNADCIYPDTNATFMDAADVLLQGSGPVRLWRGSASLTKADLAAAALNAGVPLEETYSCYHAERCGTCPSCVAVDKAFAALEGRFDAELLQRHHPNAHAHVG